MAGPRRRVAPLFGGEVRLVRHAGRFLLVQGEQVVDVTRVLGMVNNPMGQVTLRLRVTDAGRLGARLPVFEDEPEAGVESAEVEPAAV